MSTEQVQHLVHGIMWAIITCSYLMGIIGTWRWLMSFMPTPQVRRRRRR